jgi:hypothetical protein
MSYTSLRDEENSGMLQLRLKMPEQAQHQKCKVLTASGSITKTSAMGNKYIERCARSV